MPAVLENRTAPEEGQPVAEDSGRPSVSSAASPRNPRDTWSICLQLMAGREESLQKMQSVADMRRMMEERIDPEIRGEVHR